MPWIWVLRTQNQKPHNKKSSPAVIWTTRPCLQEAKSSLSHFIDGSVRLRGLEDFSAGTVTPPHLLSQNFQGNRVPVLVHPVPWDNQDPCLSSATPSEGGWDSTTSGPRSQNQRKAWGWAAVKSFSQSVILSRMFSVATPLLVHLQSKMIFLVLKSSFDSVK